MSATYVVRLVDRGEVLEYRDDTDIYRFSVDVDRFNFRRKGKKWTVHLPGTKGKYYERHELTEHEQEVMFPRIRSYLEGIRNFIWFGASYPVDFEREGPISSEIKAMRDAIPVYLANRDKRN